MRNLLFTAYIVAFISFSENVAVGQTADTTVVQTYTWEAQNNPEAAYESPGRRWFNFPSSNNGVEYQKILMYYNLKCFEDGTAGNLGFPCGEWDYLTYTYLYDHTGVIDSMLANHPLYFVNNADFESIDMTSQPIVITREYEHDIRVMDSVTDETTFNLGNPTAAQNSSLVNGTSSQSLFLYKAQELSTAGLASGDAVSRIAFAFANTPSSVSFCKIEMALTPDSIVSAVTGSNSFVTVYAASTELTDGWNDFNLLNDWLWDGTSSMLVRVSWTNAETSVSMDFQTDETNFASSLNRSGTDRYMRLDWQDEVKVPKEAFQEVSNECEEPQRHKEHKDRSLLYKLNLLHKE